MKQQTGMNDTQWGDVFEELGRDGRFELAQHKDAAVAGFEFELHVEGIFGLGFEGAISSIPKGGPAGPPQSIAGPGPPRSP